MAGQVQALGVRGVYLAMYGLTNRPEDPEFETLRADLNRRLADEKQALLADPLLQGYRELHSAVGFSNRDFVASPEALIKSGRLPQVNLLVDIYNLVSIETRLSFGAHDLARVQGNIHLRLTTGSEGYWPLGSPEPKPVRPGAYAYIDDADEVICLLEVRQVHKTRVTLETRDCFYIIQGNPAASQPALQAAAERLTALTQRFCGGEAVYLA